MTSLLQVLKKLVTNPFFLFGVGLEVVTSMMWILTIGLLVGGSPLFTLVLLIVTLVVSGLGVASIVMASIMVLREVKVLSVIGEEKKYWRVE